jgi:hypothetical protein
MHRRYERPVTTVKTIVGLAGRLTRYSGDLRAIAKSP